MTPTPRVLEFEKKNIYRIIFQGKIDVQKELAKLNAKKEKNDQGAQKILDLEKAADYEAKVPLGVRTNNQEKVSETCIFQPKKCIFRKNLS